jgi:hypothetical protein
MSELLSIPEDLAQQSIATAVAAGLQAHPAVAAATLIARLTTSLGPVVAQIITLIQAGAADLPAILQAIQAAGTTLPPWVSTVVAILLAVVKPAS